MAFIRYASREEIHSADQVDDTDNILRIHGVHGRVMRLHYDLYVEVMRGAGPLSRAQREMIAVTTSVANGCHY